MVIDLVLLSNYFIYPALISLGIIFRSLLQSQLFIIKPPLLRPPPTHCIRLRASSESTLSPCSVDNKCHHNLKEIKYRQILKNFPPYVIVNNSCSSIFYDGLWKECLTNYLGTFTTSNNTLILFGIFWFVTEVSFEFSFRYIHSSNIHYLFIRFCKGFTLLHFFLVLLRLPENCWYCLEY